MARKDFEIDGQIIGDEHPPYVIAEAGVHHDNSPELARNLILHARVAGANAIKFQTYTASKLAAKWAPTYWDEGSGKTQFEVFAERDKLKPDDYAQLFRYAREVGITLLSTPFDQDSAEMLNDLGMSSFKIASADITNHPLLETVASFGKPVMLSTGASTFDEIGESVALLADYEVPVALLHCSLSYPTTVADANLQRISRLREAFPQIVIGYSDHTLPSESVLACPLGIALGARVIEKHYTLNKLARDDDHYHAMDQEGLSRLVYDCYSAFKMVESFTEITEAEAAARQFARRSIVAARALESGTVVRKEDIDFKRPGTGISPAKVNQVVGSVLTRDLDEDELIQFKDLSSPEG